jgi:hypothetical protein
VNAITEINSFIARHSTTCDYLLLLELIETAYPALVIVPKVGGGYYTATLTPTAAEVEGTSTSKTEIRQQVKNLFKFQDRSDRPLLKGLLITGQISELSELEEYIHSKTEHSWRRIMSIKTIEDCLACAPQFIQNQYDPFNL